MTVEDYWRDLHGDACRWRTARKAHICGHRPDPVHAIEPGERYLDTGELIDPPWRTWKVCERHATEETS